MEERVLAGRYRLIAKLGQGGMGSVWRAEHLTLHTQVAIKLIDPIIAETPEIATRFRREAQAAAELRSTHIVQILDYGIDQDTPFIAMELLEGESLAARIKRLKKLTPSGTAQILSQVARALTRAHQRGIVHRDMKPDNIFIVQEDTEELVKVLDFGIAKKLEGLSLSGDIMTYTGMVLGSPYYISPEQALGQTDIDHRADIWSMGIIAFQCITGVRPLERDSLGAILMAICNDPLPRPSRFAPVPAGFDEWFARAAARNRDARFQTAAEAAAALRVIGCAVSARPSNQAALTVEALPVVVNNSSEVPTIAVHSALAMPEPTAPTLQESASLVSVTMPGTPKKSSRHLFRVLFVPALFLLVALGYAFWHWPKAEVAPVAVSSARQMPTMQVVTESSHRIAAAVPVATTPVSLAPSAIASSDAIAKRTDQSPRTTPALPNRAQSPRRVVGSADNPAGF